VEETKIMSETTSGGGCGCGKKGAHCHAAPKTEAIRNGKGSAPRNISEDFRSNYSGIKWKTAGQLKKGEKFVKTY